jgi:hypothetical protein
MIQMGIQQELPITIYTDSDNAHNNFKKG